MTKPGPLVGPFAREMMISEGVFIGATKKLFEWSKSQNCQFYAIVRDATGPSKARHKRLQEMVQGNFYPFYPWPRRRGHEIGGTPTILLTRSLHRLAWGCKQSTEASVFKSIVRIKVSPSGGSSIRIYDFLFEIDKVVGLVANLGVQRSLILDFGFFYNLGDL